MIKLAVQTVAVLGLLLLINACAGGISRQALSQVTYTGSFSRVQDNPAEFTGETVIWGGKVIEIQNQGGLTEIVALQLPLDNKNRPDESGASRGRFLIRSHQFLDPVIYPSGTLFTAVGRLQGTENRLIGEMPYPYPVVEMVELRKHEPQGRSNPRFNIGIGVGKTF